MPVGTPFKPGQSGNPKGPPVGTKHVSTLVQNILNGDEPLPPAIAATIAKATGEKSAPLKAQIIVGLLQSLQGDERWTKLLWEYGFGKVPDKQELTGADGGPIQSDTRLAVDLGSLSDDQIARMAAIAKESVDG